VLWAAGVRASSLAASLGVSRDASGRVEVRPDLSIPGHPEVFVIGDLARMVMADGSEVPGVAQGALQGGRHVAALIAAEVSRGAKARELVRRVEPSGGGQPSAPIDASGGSDGSGRRGPSERPAFRYRDKGNMATIGRAEAVVVTKHFARHGLLAWLLWWAVHIAFLIGFRNRLLVMFHWAWSWLTFKRGARLITGPIGALPPVRSIGRDGRMALPREAAPVALDDAPPP